MDALKAEIKRDKNGRLLEGHGLKSPGRPTGQSLKEFWREKFKNMSEEQKLEFSQKVAPELLFRMAEGNPMQDNEHKISGEVVSKVVELSTEQYERLIREGAARLASKESSKGTPN